MSRKLTTTEIAVLGLIAWRELSGYELTRSIDNSVRHFWSPARSRVYEILPRLLDAGLASARTSPGVRGPEKTLYRATRAGRAALRKWLNDATEPEASRSPFLLKLFFGEHATPGRLRELIDEYARDSEELLRYLRDVERRVGRSDPYALLTIRYGIHRAEATLRWADEARASVAALEPQSDPHRRR